MAIGKVSFILLIVSVLLMTDLFWKMSKIFFILDYLVPYPPSENKSKKLLVVGVMSAQDHFKERESIRNTWGQLIDPKLVDLKFLIGSKICPIAPPDRITPYVCEKWIIDTPHSPQLSTINILNNSGKAFDGYTGFTFIVKHNISVIRLGVYSRIFENCECKKLRALLYDAASGDKVASATFLRANNSKTGDFFWKTVHPVKLPEGFEGELKVTSDKNISVTCPSNVFKRGVIHNFEMQKGNFFEKFSEHSCMLVAFHYILENEEVLLKFLKEEETRTKRWKEKEKLIKYQLEIESRTYKDILFFDLIDVYKNLTLKLFEYLKWTQNIGGYKYILKTDDDVFVDVKTVLSVLTSHGYDDWDWWSCFREGFTPPKFGKWRDRLYPGKFYPPLCV
ncbi:UDP-GalNAc:beta-1,3-N-acetylgalactosaminyltransferase 2-like isoform X3 [Rhodnius prolixus]|uniref:UDP-GalNAc:beta-1, 3-N-acetylgalactosaminyltransferase 2-like isoform X3 n=1 Tax=Rhodnius prolixus TaxID=13249 RepID=UPI003D18F4A5